MRKPRAIGCGRRRGFASALAPEIADLRDDLAAAFAALLADAQHTRAA